MWTPLPRPREARKAAKEKDKGSKPKKFDGDCFWCGVCGHVMDDGQKKAAGKPQALKSPRGSDPKPKVKGKGKNGASSLDEYTTVSHLVTKPMWRWQVSSSVRSADTKGTTDETHKPAKGSRNRRSVSGRPARMEALVPMLSTLRWVRASI